ncbi:MAG: SDR family oxidoreductase [Neisseriaceae bacterium]|nr:SDR family oxidoreductase [Neisseriaceae bacterium]
MTILITGASVGFGKAACKLFVENGYKVIGSARRIEKLNALKNELGENFLPLPMDMTDKNSINNALSQIPPEWQDIELLVNNAGLALGLEPAYKCDFADWEQMIATNVLGLTYLTRQILPKMVERKKGHIINIGSVAGTYPYPGGNVYGATKAFVKQFSRNLRADLAGTRVRVSNIEPGLCGDTEFSNVRFKWDNDKAAQVYENVEFVKPEDIAEIILWIFRQPEYVNINSIEVMPVAQSYSALSVYREQD